MVVIGDRWRLTVANDQFWPCFGPNFELGGVMVAGEGRRWFASQLGACLARGIPATVVEGCKER
ncbi:hypothetical protein TorRG33x02_302590 [Trema orientale]|uniref:Uncharacterized protein n=1 Tax=Trema orientale TaxID=63057 RepID=A0A2P5C0D6_TREOI|nr:hypothetical protein TorRG33x02_302590 [Trema orientale]